MKLEARIALLILLSVLLPLSGTGIYVYFSQKSRMESVLDQQLREVGASTASLLDTYLVQRGKELALVGTSSTLRGKPDLALSGLGRYKRAFGEFDSLLFADEAGKPLAHVGVLLRTPEDADVAAMVGRWLARARRGQRLIDVAAQAGDFARYFVYAAPVEHEGRRYGWVFGQVDSARVAAIAARVRIGETGRATLFNQEGILIGHSDRRRYGYDMSAYPIMREPLRENRGNPGGFFVSGDGREKWGITLVLEQSRNEFGRTWGIIVDQTRDELYAPIRELRNAILFGTGFGALLFSVLGIGASRTIGVHRRLAESAQALEESQKRFEQFAGNSNTVFWVRTATEMLYVSPAFANIWCAQCLSFPGMRSHCFLGGVHPEDRTRVFAAFEQAMAAAAPFHETYRIVRQDGGQRWVEVHDFPVQGGESPPRRTGTAEDITDRLEAEARMREALVVYDASSQAIMSTDAAGVIRSVNPAFSAITGYAAAEVVGRKPSVLKSGRHDAEFYAELWLALRNSGRWDGEIWNRRKSGETYPEWLSIAAVRDAQGEIVEYVGLFSDISARKAQEDAIWHQANFDALTGLANRSLLLDRLERSLAQARRKAKKVGLAFLDLDGFKWINDTLGHDIGDDLLIEVAERLRGCIREQDTAARIGGDEFTVVAMDIDSAEDLVGIGEKLLDELRQPFTLAGKQHHISGSIGITVFPDDGEDVRTLLKNADIAMYKAKQAGKNRLQFYARHMQAEAQTRMLIEAELRAAIVSGSFVLHYQPILAVASGELTGVEALIRWQHPDRGLVSPLDFISVAEDCGLIAAIGEWALRESARQWRDWQRRWPAPLRMSVNVSGVQFREDSLLRLVANVLAEFEIDRGSLILEITESVLMEGSAVAEARMHALKALGVGYALDDFGTGFSSLSCLKRFPVDIVKIDRSFIHGCPDEPGNASLAEAIINMAHSLGLQVTAEGVETDAQLQFLRRLGCDYVQGFLIGRPLAAAEFEALLAGRAADLFPASVFAPVPLAASHLR